MAIRRLQFGMSLMLYLWHAVFVLRHDYPSETNFRGRLLLFKIKVLRVQRWTRNGSRVKSNWITMLLSS